MDSLSIKFVLDDEAYLPTREHDTDAGMDIRTPKSFHLGPWSSYTVNTGVHAEIPPNTQLNVWSKSGLNTNHDIVATGLIDEGFSGEIKIRMHNLSGRPYTFERGEKITQLVLTPVFYPEIIEVDNITSGDRGDGGYGSTGRF